MQQWIVINLKEFEKVIEKKGFPLERFHQKEISGETMPKIIIGKYGDKIDISDCIDGTLEVYVCTENNGVGKKLSFEEIQIISQTLTLTPLNKKERFIVKYEKKLDEDYIKKYSNDFPSTVKIGLDNLKRLAKAYNISQDEFKRFLRDDNAPCDVYLSLLGK